MSAFNIQRTCRTFWLMPAKGQWQPYDRQYLGTLPAPGADAGWVEAKLNLNLKKNYRVCAHEGRRGRGEAAEEKT